MLIGCFKEVAAYVEESIHCLNSQYSVLAKYDTWIDENIPTEI